MMLTLVEIDELRRKHAAATPGEWILFRPVGPPISVAVFNEAARQKWEGKGLGSAMWHEQIVCAWAAAPDDLEFIAAAHNAFTALLDAAARIAEIEADKEANAPVNLV